MDDLALKHGYYFLLNRDDNNKIFVMTIGKGYMNDDLKEIAIKEEGGFLNYYANGKKVSTRDMSLLSSFEDVIDAFIEHLSTEYTPNALVKEVNEKLVPFFEKVR